MFCSSQCADPVRFDRFIPKYFILFRAIVTDVGFVLFLILVSNDLLLDYRNRIGFCVLTLYPATVLCFIDSHTIVYIDNPAIFK